MGFAFNPLTGNFDLKGSGGGASYIDGEVATYTDLPLDGSAALNTAWLVREASGTWLIARKPAGIYIRTATAGVSRDADWTYAGILPDVFNDANFLLYDNADSSKNLAFQLSGISASTTRTLTVPDASGTIALTSQLGGGTKTYAVFTAKHNQPTATAFATLDTRNSIAVLDFDDATDESAVFVSIIPEAASLGSGLKIRLHWMATTATSGNVVWDVSLERMTTDLDSDSFDTIASGTAAASGTSGILTVTEITLTTIDSVTAGDGFRLKVTRDANNASDTMTGDAELVVCEIRSAA
jgi:hypothetical protein